MKKKLITISKYLWITAIVIFVSYYFYEHFEQVLQIVSFIPSFNLIVAFSTLFLAKVFLSGVSYYSTQYFDQKLSFSKMFSIYNITQLAKYIPGSIWQFVGKAGAYAKEGFPSKVIQKSIFVEMLWVLGSAFLVGIILIILGGLINFELFYLQIKHYLYIYIILFGFVGFALFFVYNKVVSFIRFLIDKRDLNKKMIVMLVPVWLLLGTSFFITLTPYMESISLSGYMSIVGLYAFAYFIGFLVPFAPAGIGIREGVLVLGVGTFISSEHAIVLASLNRVIYIMLEIIIVVFIVKSNFVQKYFFNTKNDEYIKDGISRLKKAIITGITGQDGAYLAELLLEKGYEVYGTFRRTASVNFWRIEELGIDKHPNLHLIEFDLTDQSNTIRMVMNIQPDEIYNLAAQSFVGVSFEQPLATAHITGLGAVHLLEAIRIVNSKIKFYQASTSEMFGLVQEVPQTEKTPLYPRSPYGVAKLYAHWMVINYRESYDIFGCSGILFNHESPLRGREFVTRKITDSVAKIKLGQLDVLELGNMDAKRDWGFAKEYVEGMYLMLQADKPDTYVLSTNRTETVRDFVTMAFKAVDIELIWEGKDEDEIAKDKTTGKIVVKVNPKFYRPAEVDLLIGDSKKAKDGLGWEAKTSLEELCAMMVKEDMRRNKNGFSF